MLVALPTLLQPYPALHVFIRSYARPSLWLLRVVCGTRGYRPGIVHLYAPLGLPCVPAALKSGLFWPRRSLARLPGTITVQFLPPIPPGFDRAALLPRLQDAIETASAPLLQDSGSQESGIRES